MKHQPDRFLIIDSASSAAMRIGLSLNMQTISHREIQERLQYSEMIFKMIDELLRKEGLKIDALTGIIVSTGPGSFTGLRVGMAAAKGLAMALNIPLVGVSIFKAVRERLSQKYEKTAVIIPSRRDEYYFGLIGSSELDENNIEVVSAEDLRERIGNAPVLAIDCNPDNFEKISDNIITNPNDQLNISDFYHAGRNDLESSGPDDIFRLEPLYVHRFPAQNPH